MRLIFASVSAHGHIYPLLPLAVAARDAGHDVVFATGESFHPVLRGAGLAAVSAGNGLGSAFSHALRGSRPDAPHADTIRAMAKVFGDVMPRQVVRDLEPVFGSFAPDLVIHEAANTGAGMAAKLAGVPALCHGTGRGAGPRGRRGAA